ncbi:MAG TPA: hypothetical protein PK466_07445 [Thermotogota bacterium]|nr:hypothetical protein [Thermotogota bacterium]
MENALFKPKSVHFIKTVIISLFICFCTPLFADEIQIRDFFYDDNLIGLEPIFKQKVRINSIEADSEGQVFLNTADGSLVKFLGVITLHPEQTVEFLEQNLLDDSVYLSFENDSRDNLGFKQAYVWTDDVYEYYSISVLWNAVLINNGYALPKEAEYIYKDMFFALQTRELEFVKSEVQDIKTTESLQTYSDKDIPPGFEGFKWDTPRYDIWYRMNDQIVEERNDRLKYISELYNESCLLYFFFNEENQQLRTVSYIFGFTDINQAESVYRRFVKNVRKLLPEEAIVDYKELEKADKLDSYYQWESRDAKAELRIATLTSSTHAIVLKFERK